MVLTSDINIIATSSAWRSSTRAARAAHLGEPWRTLANLGKRSKPELEPEPEP